VASGLHHVEIWVADVERARQSFGWLLIALGWSVDQEWDSGTTWRSGDVYIVATRPPTLSGESHDRRLPGVNHLALHGGRPADVDRIAGEATHHGWHALYAERYPHAGGPGHYAAYLEDDAGFKVEIVGEAGT